MRISDWSSDVCSSDRIRIPDAALARRRHVSFGDGGCAVAVRMAIGRRTGLECQQSKAGGAKFEVCSHASGFLTALALLLLTFPKAAESPSMRKLLGAVEAAASLSAASTQAQWADPDKDESGHGRGRGQKNSRQGKR